MGTTPAFTAGQVGRGNRAELDAQRSTIALAPDELFDAAIGFIVGHLDGRMFGEIGGRGMQDAADAAIERELAAADGVDGDAGGVW